MVKNFTTRTPPKKRLSTPGPEDEITVAQLNMFIAAFNPRTPEQVAGSELQPQPNQYPETFTKIVRDELDPLMADAGVEANWPLTYDLMFSSIGESLYLPDKNRLPPETWGEFVERAMIGREELEEWLRSDAEALEGCEDIVDSLGVGFASIWRKIEEQVIAQTITARKKSDAITVRQLNAMSEYLVNVAADGGIISDIRAYLKQHSISATEDVPYSAVRFITTPIITLLASGDLKCFPETWKDYDKRLASGPGLTLSYASQEKGQLPENSADHGRFIYNERIMFGLCEYIVQRAKEVGQQAKSPVQVLARSGR